MSTFSFIPLSAATDYRGIKIAGVASNGSDATLLHIAQSVAGGGSDTLPDFLHLEFYNSDTVARPLTLWWGGLTAPDDQRTHVLLPGETRLITHQIPTRHGLAIKASSVTTTWIDGALYTGAANVIVCCGGSHVQRQLT